MNSNLPVVSVVCITYNHEAFIAEAIEGFLIQETTFPIEILIHDDASTDRTPEIIRSYQSKHPDLIKPILQVKNQYSSRGFGFLGDLFAIAQGKYIALCEGDDYWTDTFKLKKQVEFLEKNSDFSLCFHDSYVVDEMRNNPNWLYCHNLKASDVDIYRLIFDNFIPSASVVYRREAILNIPSWFIECPMGDWPLHLIAAKNGKIKYMDEIMSVYRIHNQGIWSSTNDLEKLRKVIAFLEILILNFPDHYKPYISQSLALKYEILSKAHIDSSISKHEYSITYSEQLIYFMKHLEKINEALNLKIEVFEKQNKILLNMLKITQTDLEILKNIDWTTNNILLSPDWSIRADEYYDNIVQYFFKAQQKFGNEFCILINCQDLDEIEIENLKENIFSCIFLNLLSLYDSSVNTSEDVTLDINDHNSVSSKRENPENLIFLSDLSEQIINILSSSLTLKFQIGKNAHVLL